MLSQTGGIRSRRQLSRQVGRVWMTLLGLLLAIPGIGGTVLMTMVLFSRFSEYTEKGREFVLNQAIFEGLWCLVFMALTVLAISLYRSGRKRRRYNIIPGPTLYVMGAALVVIGLMLALYSEFLTAAMAAAVGLVLMWAEWRYDEV